MSIVKMPMENSTCRQKYDKISSLSCQKLLKKRLKLSGIFI